MARRQFWKTFRLLILLFILFIVAVDAWLTKKRSTDWLQPLRLVIYPINGDGSERSAQYIDTLEKGVFADVENFVQEEAAHYQLSLAQPVTIELAPPVMEIPPAPPFQGSVLQTMWWSLHMRYWALTRDNYQGPPLDVQIFVVYFDPKENNKLRHSLGLEKGLIGVVNAFASDELAAKNNVVIAHEFLHTLGATDKYDLRTGQPLFPQGYAEPDLQPRYPQTMAEIMGGAVALSPDESQMPDSLEQAVVGPQTAAEINWLAE